jgi:hypothetical protein
MSDEKDLEERFVDLRAHGVQLRRVAQELGIEVGSAMVLDIRLSDQIKARRLLMRAENATSASASGAPGERSVETPPTYRKLRWLVVGVVVAWVCAEFAWVGTAAEYERWRFFLRLARVLSAAVVIGIFAWYFLTTRSPVAQKRSTRVFHTVCDLMPGILSGLFAILCLERFWATRGRELHFNLFLAFAAVCVVSIVMLRFTRRGLSSGLPANPLQLLCHDLSLLVYSLLMGATVTFLGWYVADGPWMHRTWDALARQVPMILVYHIVLLLAVCLWGSLYLAVGRACLSGSRGWRVFAGIFGVVEILSVLFVVCVVADARPKPEVMHIGALVVPFFAIMFSPFVVWMYLPPAVLQWDAILFLVLTVVLRAGYWGVAFVAFSRRPSASASAKAPQARSPVSDRTQQ